MDLKDLPAELVALAARDPSAAVAPLTGFFTSCLRAGNDVSGVKPVAVSHSEDRQSYLLTVGEGQRALVLPLELGALSELIYRPDQLYVQLAKAFVKRSSGSLLDILGVANVVQARDVLDLKLPDGWEKTSIEDGLAAAIIESDRLLVIGPSASGKTTAVTSACKSLAAQRRTRCQYCDIGYGLPPIIDILRFSLEASPEPHRERVVILDNCHAQLGALPIIEDLVSICQMLGTTKFVFIAWPSVRQRITEVFLGIDVSSVSGDKVISELSQRLRSPLGGQQLVDVQRLARGDVLIGATLIDSFRRNGSVLSPAQLAQAISSEPAFANLSIEAKRCLLDVCRVNTLDIPVKLSYLSSLDSGGIDELLLRGLLKSEGEFVRVGHRSRARLLHGSLVREVLGESASLEIDSEYTAKLLDYFKTLRRDELFSTLAAVDASLAENSVSDGSKLAFSSLLRSVASLIRQLELAQEVDASWGGNIASAVFSGMAFSWGSPRQWDRVASWVRSKVTVTETGLLFPIGPGAERADFDLIRSAMQAEEGSVPILPSHWEQAATIDMDVAYRNWLLGLLLCFEGTAARPDRKRRAALLDLAARWAQSDGSYYPRRVPWITARVVLGFGACGESVDTNDQARNASRWLLSIDRSGKLAPTGFWPSGTGDWNTPEQCSVMVLLSLRSVGVPFSDILDDLQIGTFKKKLEAFDANVDQIDILLILQLIADYGATDDFSDKLLDEIVGAYSNAHVLGVSSLDPVATKEESSKSPFVVNSLLSILWDRLARAFNIALESLAATSPVARRPSALTSTPSLSIERCELMLQRIDAVITEKTRAVSRARNARMDNSTIQMLIQPISLITEARDELRRTLDQLRAVSQPSDLTMNIAGLEQAMGACKAKLDGVIPNESLA